MLDCEHFLQGLQHLGHGRRRKLSKPLCQSSGINRSNLVHGDEATAFLEPTRNPPRIGSTAGGHGGYDRRAQVLIELVGRENETRARLANLTAGRWIETHKVHVTAAADLLSHTRDKGLYLESLLEFQWGAGTRPRFAFMRTAEILYTSGG